ncbi:MAG: hypothetical protein Tsb0014_12180 [Pleurocapsa sp.]
MSKKTSHFLIFVVSIFAPLLIFNTDNVTAQNAVQNALNEAYNLSKQNCKSSGNACSDCAQKQIAPRIIKKYRISNPRVVSQVYAAAVKACND